MKQIFNKKNLLLIFVFISIVLLFKWGSTGFMIQEHLEADPNIGKTIHFAQPVSYIERETPAIVPIVAKIKKEITGLHLKYESEKKNAYLPSDTDFIVTDAYAYRDILNKRSIYYVLSGLGVNYILSEDALNRLQKPIYNNAKVPSQP